MKFQEQMNNANVNKELDTNSQGSLHFDAQNSKWGKLVDKQPTAFARELIASGVDVSVIKENLIKNFNVNETYANLVYQTLRSQKTIIRNNNLVNILLEVNLEKDEDKKQFLSNLKQKVSEAREQIVQKALVVRSIYVSGNIINEFQANEVDEILSEIAWPVSEFTVEVNGFENVTEEKIEVLKSHDVTRLVLKPKTFLVKTLKAFENKHTNQQVYSTYMLALKHSFVVDMVLVAGLGGESFANFKKSLSTMLELSPHNITVVAKEESFENNANIDEMMLHAFTTLLKTGYKPYYFEKTKNFDFSSKIGFALDGKLSLFNIDTQEKTLNLITI